MAGKNILFVCSANVNRSPSAEFWFSLRNPENVYESAGSCEVACRIHNGKYVTSEQIENADRIICMDERNRNELNKNFPGFEAKIEVAGILDQYSFFQLELIFEFMNCIKL